MPHQWTDLGALACVRAQTCVLRDSRARGEAQMTPPAAQALSPLKLSPERRPMRNTSASDVLDLVADAYGPPHPPPSPTHEGPPCVAAAPRSPRGSFSFSTTDAEPATMPRNKSIEFSKIANEEGSFVRSTAAPHPWEGPTSKGAEL